MSSHFQGRNLAGGSTRIESAQAQARTRHSLHSHREVGALIRLWREARGLSQLALSLDVGISSRHLSFVENARSRPSADLLIALATRLEVPLRERNELLLAGGFAPRYRETSIDAPALAMVRTSIDRLLAAHDPYPGVALDRCWNVVIANQAAQRLVELLPAALRTLPFNTFRTGLHPDGLRRLTSNFDQWGAYLLGQLDRLVMRTLDPGASALLDEVTAWPGIRELRQSASPASANEPQLLVPVIIDLNGHRLSMFTTLATLGSPLDVTLSELTLELFYPADEDTAQTLRNTFGATP